MATLAMSGNDTFSIGSFGLGPSLEASKMEIHFLCEDSDSGTSAGVGRA